MDLIGRCNIALAPHKRLPPDVLQSIFHFCGTRVQFPLKSKQGQDLRLLHITHVCFAWRQLALEMPALWSKISIYLSEGDWKQHDRTLSAARQWFDRAQDMRRSLSTFFNGFASGIQHVYVSPHLHGLWEKLLEFMALYRLEELDVHYPINRVALKLPNHVWPSIRRLNLEDDGHCPGEQQLFSNFGKLSNLRHLKVIDSLHLDGIDQIAPWHQLRTFEVWGLTGCSIAPSSCLNVLRQSRLLERCHIKLSQESSFTSTEEKIVLTNMDYFEVGFLGGLEVPMFLRPLVMPNIVTFSLSVAIASMDLSCDMPALLGIIQRSGGMRRIRRLHIGPSSAVLDVGILLELLPSLDSISIRSGHLTDNTMELLSSGKLGPRLCDIELKFPHNADKILSMVESRYQNATRSPDSEQNEDPPCPLKSIIIPCTAVNSPESYECRIEILSSMCNAYIQLYIAQESSEDEDSEDEDDED